MPSESNIFGEMPQSFGGESHFDNMRPYRETHETHRAPLPPSESPEPVLEKIAEHGEKQVKALTKMSEVLQRSIDDVKNAPAGTPVDVSRLERALNHVTNTLSRVKSENPQPRSPVKPPMSQKTGSKKSRASEGSKDSPNNIESIIYDISVNIGDIKTLQEDTKKGVKRIEVLADRIVNAYLPRENNPVEESGLNVPRGTGERGEIYSHPKSIGPESVIGTAVGISGLSGGSMGEDSVPASPSILPPTLNPSPLSEPPWEGAAAAPPPGSENSIEELLTLILRTNESMLVHMRSLDKHERMEDSQENGGGRRKPVIPFKKGSDKRGSAFGGDEEGPGSSGGGILKALTGAILPLLGTTGATVGGTAALSLGALGALGTFAGVTQLDKFRPTAAKSGAHIVPKLLYGGGDDRSHEVIEAERQKRQGWIFSAKKETDSRVNENEIHKNVLDYWGDPTVHEGTYDAVTNRPVDLSETSRQMGSAFSSVNAYAEGRRRGEVLKSMGAENARDIFPITTSPPIINKFQKNNKQPLQNTPILEGAAEIPSPEIRSSHKFMLKDNYKDAWWKRPGALLYYAGSNVKDYFKGNNLPSNETKAYHAIMTGEGEIYAKKEREDAKVDVGGRSNQQILDDLTKEINQDKHLTSEEKKSRIKDLMLRADTVGAKESVKRGTLVDAWKNKEALKTVRSDLLKNPKIMAKNTLMEDMFGLAKDALKNPLLAAANLPRWYSSMLSKESNKGNWNAMTDEEVLREKKAREDIVEKRKHPYSDHKLDLLGDIDKNASIPNSKKEEMRERIRKMEEEKAEIAWKTRYKTDAIRAYMSKKRPDALLKEDQGIDWSTATYEQLKRKELEWRKINPDEARDIDKKTKESLKKEKGPSVDDQWKVMREKIKGPLLSTSDQWKVMREDLYSRTHPQTPIVGGRDIISTEVGGIKTLSNTKKSENILNKYATLGGVKKEDEKLSKIGPGGEAVLSNVNKDKKEGSNISVKTVVGKDGREVKSLSNVHGKNPSQRGTGSATQQEMILPEGQPTLGEKGGPADAGAQAPEVNKEDVETSNALAQLVPGLDVRAIPKDIVSSITKAAKDAGTSITDLFGLNPSPEALTNAGSPQPGAEPNFEQKTSRSDASVPNKYNELKKSDNASTGQMMSMLKDALGLLSSIAETSGASARSGGGGMPTPSMGEPLTDSLGNIDAVASYIQIVEHA